MRPIRTAIVGAGRWGSTVARRMQDVRGYRVVAVVDADHGATKDLAADMPAGTIRGTEVFATLIEAGAEAVVIATPPNSGRLEQVYDALDAGVALVRIEKPVAVTYTEARDIHQLVDEAGANGVVGHTPLHCPAARAFRATVNAMRDDVVLHTVRIGTRPAVCDALLDLGVHDFAMAHYAIGDLTVTDATTDANGDVVVNAIGAKGGRLVARVGVDPARAERRTWAELATHPGEAVVEYDESQRVVRAGESTAYTAQLDPLGVELAKHIGGGGTPLSVGVAAVRTAAMATMQLEGGQVCA